MSTPNARVALVTGANRGLGLETCRQLLAVGMRVVMTGRNHSLVRRAIDGLGQSSQSVVGVQMDVTSTASIESAHAEVTERFGTIDVLVNNAGVLFSQDGDVFSISMDGYRKSFETNLFGVIEVCRVFVPPMVARGYGRIVNVSSGAGQFASMATYAPAYSISKTALNAFTLMLAETCRGRGVLANAVDPGWVRTDMGGPSAPRSVEQGVESIVWLATLPENGPTGGFFRDKAAIAW